MRFPWTPIAGKPGAYTCGEHGGEFARGHTCPGCSVGSVAYGQTGSEAQELASSAAKRELPTMLDHEEWFLGIAGLAENAAAALIAPPPPRRRAKGKRARRSPAFRPSKASAIAYDRLLNTAIKARTRSAAITEWREDWERTERHARNAQRYARGRAPQTDATQVLGEAN